MPLRVAVEIAKGIVSFVPGMPAVMARSTGGTNSARYCYSVWLRHLTMCRTAGLPMPRVIAELGPGDSIGAGLAGLLSGASRYIALDVKPFAAPTANLMVLDELANLFAARAPIPGPDEFPEVKPSLASYEFPRHLIDEAALRDSLRPERLAALREAVRHPRNADDTEAIVCYAAPWDASSQLQPETVDLIFSQAVLEHVEDIEGAYRAMRGWLRSGGAMSHQIDFRSHGITADWNGHWALGPRTWRLIRGRRVYLLNRAPRSRHRSLLRENCLRLVHEVVASAPDGLTREDFKAVDIRIVDSDLEAAGAYMLAVVECMSHG